jgi:glucosylceramidase
MTRLLSISNFSLLTITSLGLVLAAAACSSDDTPDGKGSGGTGATGATGATGGSSGGTAGKPAGSGGSTAGSGTGATGGSTTGGTGGSAGGVSGGSAGAAPATGGMSAGGSAGVPAVGGAGGGSGGVPAAGGSAGLGGMDAGGSAGSGMAGSGGEPPVNLPPLVTSAPNAYWKTDAMPMDSTAAATVTVSDTMGQTWEGFGGAFNELGWKVLTSKEMQDAAIKLLFSSTDGAAFVWGRIPMGASDYAEIRYTLDDNAGADPAAQSGDANRPAANTSLTGFSLGRDKMYLIPYIKAAQAVRPTLRFWGSPWTPPIWMKTGFMTTAGGSGTAKKPSYYDGGSMKNDTSFLTAYAEYYKKFVQGYKDEGINVEIVSPQNEPGYEQNYPSCLWDKTLYTTWVKTLATAMSSMNVKVMLGTLSNAGDSGRTDLDIATAVLADPTAKAAVSMVGVQWGVLEKVNGGQTFQGLPIWATEHKCGNYPWNPSTGCGETSSSCPAYNNSQAPNDQAYGVESWIYIRNAINKGKVTSYSAWNMVLDTLGLGNDTSRDWKQDTLLVAAGGQVKPTPAYYVFRHLSQYVQVGAKQLGTSGGDAVAFKNPDGSIAVAMYNSGAANSAYVVSAGGKKLQFAMPGTGWATLLVKP